MEQPNFFSMEATFKPFSQTAFTLSQPLFLLMCIRSSLDLKQPWDNQIPKAFDRDSVLYTIYNWT